MIAEFVFWASTTSIVYAYLGYPLALLLISRLRSRTVLRAGITPRVSFIITARNEAARIREKIENSLACRYPAHLLEIIVASDCSTDGTDRIVEAYAPAVRLAPAVRRGGKEAAQRLAIEASTGDILVFSDVATALASDAISEIVRNFADPTVGCVSSVDRFVDDNGRPGGEGAYVRYEMWLRTLETRVNSLVGLSGSFFAARREVCDEWPVNRQSDFSTLLRTVRRGQRGVLDVRCAGYYRDITDPSNEFSRKVRTVVRGIAVLTANASMLNPWRYGLFAWQLASHKLFRWLVPFAMIAALVSNAALRSSPVYEGLLIAQVAVYAAAILGFWLPGRLLRLPFFLLQANLAVFTAWCRYLCGDRMVTWTPSKRTAALPQVNLP